MIDLIPSFDPIVLSFGCRYSINLNRRAKEEIMADEQKCKNPPCTCKPQPGGKYCSASCEGTGDTIELDCDCSHEECQGNF